MWHLAFIAAHAITGLIALVTGLLVMRHGRLFDVYLGSLAGMALFLVLAIGVTWDTLDTAERILFTAFAALAGFMLWLAVRARGHRPLGGASPSASYLDDVGFTVVALFDAVAVIAVLDAGAPIWAVVGTGVVLAIAGHFALRWAKRVLTAPGRASAPAPAREGERPWPTS
jgi:hypothetical protein